MAKSDRRVQYTKRVLKEAVLSLLKIKSIDELTIKEICESADVNRGTFYLHYSQPLDVLREIENDFIETNLKSFDTYWGNERDPKPMETIFLCIMENKELCRILMGENGDPQFMKRMVTLSRDAVIEEWQKEFPAAGRENLDFLFDFVFTGTTRLILNWIDDDRGISAEAFAQRLERLGHYSLVAAGEFQ